MLGEKNMEKVKSENDTEIQSDINYQIVISGNQTKITANGKEIEKKEKTVNWLDSQKSRIKELKSVSTNGGIPESMIHPSRLNSFQDEIEDDGIIENV